MLTRLSHQLAKLDGNKKAITTAAARMRHHQHGRAISEQVGISMLQQKVLTKDTLQLYT